MTAAYLRAWRAIAVTVLCACCWCGWPSVADAMSAPQSQDGRVRLQGNVLPALQQAVAASAQPQPQPMTVTLVLRRDDEAGFQQYLHDVYDPSSPIFRRFLTQAQLSDRFGPSPADYAQVQAYLQSQGFRLVQGSANRLTLTVAGSRSQAEKAFSVRIGDYRIGTRTFYANDGDPALPAAIAPRVQAIAGLSSLAMPAPVFSGAPPNSCGNPGASSGASKSPEAEAGGTCPPSQDDPCAKALAPGGFRELCRAIESIKGVAKALNDWISSLFSHSPTRLSSKVSATTLGGIDGAGQTIGLLEFDSFQASDVANFLSWLAIPASQINHLSSVAVNGGASLGAGETEVLLDIDSVLLMAPGADVVVYDAAAAGPNSASYQQMFNAMISGGVTVISNSWTSCENQHTLSDVQSVDAILQTAAASGISVFNAAGDTGSTCLDGSASTIGVPADSPHATAVGGSSVTIAAGFTYGGETWWDGSASTPVTGQGGFGTSRFFARPGFQDGLNSSSMRSVPDVVTLGDPFRGMRLCQADAGGCPTGLLYAGTSLSAPMWSAIAALLNQALGANLGNVNQSIYPFANTDAFHGAATLGSDFAHVGLGSPNIDKLYLALSGQVPGAVSAADSTVTSNIELPPFFSAPAAPVPADGTSQGVVVVRLLDANGNYISGKTIELTPDGGSASISSPSAVTSADNGAAIFYVTDLTPETIVFSATDTTDALPLTQTASLTFGVPPAASGSIVAFANTEPADGTTTDTITVTLQDALARPTPGKEIQLNQTGNSVISGPVPAVTDSNGQIEFTVTDTVQEAVTYTAVDVTDGNLDVPGSAGVTFSAGGLANCGSNNTGDPNINAGPGYRMEAFATGFIPQSFSYGSISEGCRGAYGLAFDSGGNLFVSNMATGNVYKFGPGGGVADSGTLITTTALGPTLESLAFGADGKLYGARNATTGNFTTGAVIEIDPSTGDLVRTIASSITCASFLVTDPASGDLFVDDSCGGGGSDNYSIWRISDPGGTPSTSVYATTLSVNGGMSFAPGGTLYVDTYSGNGIVNKITGTGNAMPGQVTALSGITGPYLSIAATGSQGNGDAQSLLLTSAVGADGFPPGIRSFDATTDPVTTTSVIANNAWGNVEIVGPDGCLYVSTNIVVYKITNADGSCPINTDGMMLTLMPASVSPNPTQGDQKTFTATFHRATVPEGTPVSFQITGANAGVLLGTTNANGVASVTYSGVNAGSDTIVASATVDSSAVASNPAHLTWDPGPHTTFLSLNTSPSGASAGAPVTLRAGLFDVSGGSPAPIAGATVHFSVDAIECSGTTDASGMASCSLTVPAIGGFTLTATYAGSGSYLPASAAELFTTNDLIFANGFEAPL